MVFDTSAYINGQHDHYPLPMFERVWAFAATNIENDRILLPREVYRELGKKEDALQRWIVGLGHKRLNPSEQVQRRAGEIRALFPKDAKRNVADPWVLAEAEARGCAVVTYEGRSHDSQKTKNWAKRMPGICHHLEIECFTVATALERLDFRL